ncbi:MAG: universal stress protein [Azospirillaceae bacterium]|nr:universal stress protein [Azospirillaceae bacterium]
MTIRHILVHIDATPHATARLTVAIALARRFDANLTGLFAQKESFAPGIVARRASQHLEQAAEDCHRHFDAAIADSGITGRWWQLAHGEQGFVVGETVICARYADLTIVGQHEPGDHNDPTPEDLAEQVILNSGHPVLVLPYAGTFTEIGSRTIVAWNASREAARAVADALPFLTAANQVVVLALRPSGSDETDATLPTVDIGDWLRCHGITARVDQFPAGSIGTANTLLAQSFDEGANLMVMGAYGNYSFPLRYRGSNTRQILREMTLPVLFSH